MSHEADRVTPPADGACAVHQHHGAAQPLVLQSHHVFPKYLQAEAYGDDTVRDNRRANLCGTAHDSVHHFIDYFVSGKLDPSGSCPETYRSYRGEWLLAVMGWKRYLEARSAATST